MYTSQEEPKSQHYQLIELSEDQREADLDWAIGLNRKLLKILGLWSYPGESRWQIIRSNLQIIFWVLGIFSFMTLPQILALIKVWSNMILIVDNLIPNLPAITSQLKVIIPWLNKKVLTNVINEIEEDWCDHKSTQERDVMLKYAAIARMMTIAGLFGGTISVVCCFIPLIFGTVPRTITNLTDKPGALFPLQAVYLHDTSTPYHYYLTLMSQFFGSFLATIAYTGIDVLFGMFVLHVCGQLENLAYRIEIMADTKSENFQKILIMNIRNHYRLIRLAQMIEQVFTLLLLAVFGFIAIIFCLMGFQLITVLGEATVDVPVSQIIYYSQCLSYCLFLMFIYSWVGENLVTHSEAIHTAVSNCNWIRLNPKEARQLTLLFLRSQHPLQITAGKLVPLTLRSFASLIKTSVGYISCLLAVRE